MVQLLGDKCHVMMLGGFICCIDAQNEKMFTDPKDFNICHALLLLLQSLNITFAI